MLVTFENVVVTNVRTGVSNKTGNPYGFLQFFVPASSEIFELPFFGDDVQALERVSPNTQISKLTFFLEPAPRGGVRLKLARGVK